MAKCIQLTSLPFKGLTAAFKHHSSTISAVYLDVCSC